MKQICLTSPRFKDFKFLQSKNSKKNILPAEWLAKATNCFKVEFHRLWSIEGVEVPELAEAIIAEDVGTSFSTKKQHGISVGFFFKMMLIR